VESARTERRQLAFLVPIVLVNLMALAGQAAWAYGEAIRGPLHGLVALSICAALTFGLTLESIGVYLMLQAHDATMADQSSGSLRLAAYAVAAVMAVLNYDHWSAYDRALGVAFALLSMVSPFLWSVRAKAAHRAQQAARGIVDPAGVKLSTGRKIWHPLRSLGVVRWASWAGEVDPARAVSGWEGARSGQSAPLQGQIESAQSESAWSAPEIESVPVEGDVIERETESAEESVTETEIVTRTVERKRSVSRSAERERLLRERVATVQSKVPTWRERPVTYTEIKSALGISGAETIKPIYAALQAERERIAIND
jgi:hypothetical protein